MLGLCARLVGLTLAATLIAASSVHAQDYFEQKKRELAIQAQQTVADVTSAVDKSRELEKTSASQAKSLLEKNLLTVNDSSALDDQQRADLRSRLLSRLKEVDASVREQKTTGDSAGRNSADKAAREEKERQAQEKLQGQQKSVFDQSRDRIESNKKTVGALTDLRKAKEQGMLGVTQSIDKAASKMTEERITEYFLAKSDKRKTSSMTKEEVALLKALNSTISVDFSKGSKFKEVMDYLSERAGISIFPDTGSLNDANVDYESEVKFKAGKLTLRTVLKKILGDLKLTYVIKDGVVLVITPDRAKDYVVTRIYPVGELVTPVAINPRAPPAAMQAQMMNQANQIMQMIMNTVDPASWAGNSERGFGTMSFDPVTKSLVIRHTAEMHYMLGGSFGQ